MKQKKCPQCKNLISVTAPTCLCCGRPNKFITNSYVKRKWQDENKKNKKNIFKILISKKLLFIFIIVVIILIVCLYFKN